MQVRVTGNFPDQAGTPQLWRWAAFLENVVSLELCWAEPGVGGRVASRTGSDSLRAALSETKDAE